MEIDFLKMQGCGDDVIVLDGTRLPADASAQFPRLARRMLHRSVGVGGTALVVLGAGEGALLPARCLDPIGEERPIPCNAARCAARYATDSGAVNANEFVIEGAQGRLRAQIIDSAHVRVEIGAPISREKSAEIRESLENSFTREATVNGRTVTYTPVSFGRPCAVIFVPDFSFPLRRTAREIASGEDFPDGTGIAFAQVCSREELRLKTWDAPGDGISDACGAAAAALVAAVVNGLSDREVFVRLPGGDVFLQWDESDNRIWVTGPALYVFTGTYDFTPESGE